MHYFSEDVMKFLERLDIFIRLHFLQALWNYKGMQNLGCLFAIRPVLKRLYSGDKYVEAEKRHTQYFNTHPYFAPICIGVAAKYEEDLMSGNFSKPEMIPVLKSRMSGPLAAVGDAFFWETVRPVIGSLAALSVYVSNPGSSYSIYALIFLLSIYIIPVEWIRWMGFDWGYNHGMNVVDILKKRNFHGSMRRIRNIGALIIGLVSVFYVADGLLFSNRQMIFIAIRAGFLGLLILATMRKWSPTFLFYLTVIGGGIVGGSL